MAMHARSKGECDEILEYFRSMMPAIDDALLQELAGNFENTTLSCCDTCEFLELLDVPGPQIVLRGKIPNESVEEITWNGLFPELATKKIDLATVASVLCVVKASKNPMKVFNRLHRFLENDLHPAAVVGGPLHEDRNLGNETSVLLVLSGVGTPCEVLDARWREYQAKEKPVVEREMEIPAFLRTQKAETP